MRERPLGARAPLALGLVFAALSLALSVFALARAWDLDLAIAPNADPACPWRAPTGCVREIAGVRLDGFTLAPEVEYLTGPGARRRWFSQQDALYHALAGHAEVTVVIDDAPRPVAVRRRPLAQVLRIGGPVLFTAFVLIAVGAFVLRRRPEVPAARALFGLCVGGFACILPTFANSARGVGLDARTSAVLWALNLVALAVCGANLLRLAAVFPERAPSAWRARASGGLPVVVGVLCAALDLAGVAPSAAVVFLVSVLAVASAWLLLAYRRAASQVQALQTRWILWGYAIPFVIIGLTRVPVLLSGDAQDSQELLVTPSALAFPVALGFAVLRNRLFDIEVVIRRTMAGAAITAAALCAYHLALVAFAVRQDPAGGLGVTFLTAMVLSFVLQPVQARLESRLDRLFFRNRHDYLHALGRLPDALAGCADAADAAAHALRVLRGAMESKVALVALDPSLGGAVWSEGVGEGTRADAPWAALHAVRGPRITDAEASDAVARWMTALGADALFPLRTADAFIGVLACATPRGADVFTADDIEHLSATASALALAMSRAAAFETIRQMNASLEASVRQRTEELDAVRMRLYQREKMSSVALLAAGVAHELNSPLGVIVSTSEQLLDTLSKDGASARATRLATLGLEAARRASGTVGALLAFSRPGARDPEWTDLRGCFEAALRVAGPTLRKRAVTASLHMDGLPRVLCHPALIGQVALNLVLNAAAAMVDGGAVTVRGARGDDGAVRVSVEDTGPGVDPALRSKIFEPFFTTKTQGEGLGLGLALCFGVMDLHGGRIWEEGELGRGARFVIAFPPAPAEGQSASAADTASAMPSSV